MSFICHIHNYTEYNEEWNVFSAFNPSKCTHLEQWAADCAAPGEHFLTSCRSRDSNPQPWVTSGFKSNSLSIRPTTAPSSLALFCYLVTLPEVDHSRYFAIFTTYRSIYQFPATIEICLVYLLSVEFDSWSGVSACFRMADGDIQILILLRDVTWEPLSWLVVSLWRNDALRKFG